MKKLFVALVLSSLLLTGCAATQPALGGLFSKQVGPGQVVDNDVKAEKVGRAKASSIIGMFASGDASISAAMEDGGISKIHHVDYEYENVFGIISGYTTVVYGE